MARSALVGLRTGMSYETTEQLSNGVFVMIDSAKSGETVKNFNGFVKIATAGASFQTGVVGVVATGVIHGKAGTATDPYASGALVNVVKRGVVHCMYDTTEGVSAPARDGLVCIGAGGKIKPFTAGTITPTATLSADPTKTEVQAYIAEFAAKFAADQNSIVGRVVGEPDTTSKTAAIELFGLPSFQEQ